MASNIFTPEFYKAFYEAVVDAGNADDIYEDICEGKSVPIDFYVGEYKWHPSLLSTFSCQSYLGLHLISREAWKIQSFSVSRSMK